MSDNKTPTNFDLYKVALDTRNMEISLFWQRSNYFLVLNTAAAIGFFFKATEDYQFLIGLFGVAISLLWFGINLGSKYWQSRWEFRLKKAEKKLNEDLDVEIEYFSASWDTIKSDVKQSLESSGHSKFRKCFDFLVLCKPSVSFIMTLLSVIFVFLWVGLLLTSFAC